MKQVNCTAVNTTPNQERAVVKLVLYLRSHKAGFLIMASRPTGGGLPRRSGLGWTLGGNGT